MKNRELIKRIECRHGILTIRCNQELGERLIKFSKAIDKIGMDVTQYIEKNDRDGTGVDVSKYWSQLAKEFDKVFGRGSCRIVFGGNMISLDMLDEFIDKMQPYFDAWAKEGEDMAC